MFLTYTKLFYNHCWRTYPPAFVLYSNEQSELRNKLIDRVDVLNKVKELFLIPKLEMIPAKYVAEYYDIDYQALNQCIKRNHEELESDGILTCTLTRIQREVQDVTPVKQVDRVHFSITVNDNVEYIVHNGKNTYLSPRAVLRIGMLLRDSEVAKEVRTQLLKNEKTYSTLALYNHPYIAHPDTTIPKAKRWRDKGRETSGIIERQ